MAFKDFGDIIDVNVSRKSAVGFVTFKRPLDAQAVVDAVHNGATAFNANGRDISAEYARTDMRKRPIDEATGVAASC